MLEIFQFDFMIRAFIAGILTAAIAPMIGTFLVVRRYSLMADTLAHVSLLGVAIGLLANINPLLTAIIVATISAISMEKLRKGKKILGESVLALFLTGGLAIAIVLISLANGFNANLFSFLFGSISTVSMNDLYLIIPLSIIVVAVIYIFYKEMFLVSLDEELAEASGINAKLLNYALMVLAAVTVALSMRIVGVLLIGALMVIPVITATQLGRSFGQTFFISVLISLVSVIVGLFLSYYLSLASGGTIVVVALLIFLMTALLTKSE